MSVILSSYIGEYLSSSLEAPEKYSGQNEDHEQFCGMQLS